MTDKRQQLLQRNIGRLYDVVRHEIEEYDWEGIYPEVDANGNLTGEMLLGDDAHNHVICDVTRRGLIVDDRSTDAMVRSSEIQP